ncbi:MAG: PspC domain-containing protein [Bacteroidales bacterium]|nr:PspC domain-containing protein [Bacteroidales bacterium]
MKTTITINLNNILFHIEEDAYEKLKTYLNSIEEYFKNIDERREIIVDIEARIAELFKEKLGKTKEVITDSDVEEIIKIIGNPEEIGGTGQQSENKSEHEKSYSKYSKRRIYRDPDNRILGGVCSGIGAYLNTDPVIVRVVFVLIFLGFGIGLLIYILLWIVVPEAKTEAEKYEMRGESFNISNIGKNIKEEFENVKKGMNL